MNNSVLTEEIARTAHQFTIEMVDSPEQLREVFRLRYQVYCVEREWETSQNGEETDDFDPHSRHVLLRHKSDGEVVGAVRLIGCNRADLGNSFPIQHVVEPSLIRHLPLITTGEISRFAISKTARMVCANASLLRLLLVRGLVQLSNEMGVTHWLAVMERSLVRLNQRNEIYFDSIGPLVSYHGPRQPMAVELMQMLGRVRREQFPTWHFLTVEGTLFHEREMSREAA